MAAGIFISYRRIEATAHVHAVYERLHREFGAQAVFIDLESFDFGVDFVESLGKR